MKTLSLLIKIAAFASLLTAVACTASTSPDSKNTKSASSAATTDSEEANDKIVCKVDGDCDSDETCVSGKCTGLDGDTE